VAATLLLVSRYVPGIVVVGWYPALFGAFLLGVLNAVVRPILVILTLPATILTLGLFLFIVNGFMFWLASSFVEGFEVDGLIPAVMGALIVSVVSIITSKLLK
jgi:putative membrane protein